MSIRFHVERATAEDLPAIWDVNEASGGTETERGALLAAVEVRGCLVARRGWAVSGFAVRQPDFFGYALVTKLVVHPDNRCQGAARALMAYVEKTTLQDRLFTTARADNTAAAAAFAALGYTACGDLTALHPDGTAQRIYVKHLD